MTETKRIFIKRGHGGEPPTQEAWDVFIASLALAKAAPDHPSLPAGMNAVLQVLTALNDYIAPQEVINREKLAVPLLHLVTAINDLSRGLEPSLFKPVNRPHHRPKKSSAENNLIGTCALAIEKLMESGVDRNIAVKRVQAALKRRSVSRVIEKTTLLGWRERIMQGPDGPMPPEAIARFHSALPPEAGANAVEQATWLLNTLTSAPGFDFG